LKEGQGRVHPVCVAKDGIRPKKFGIIPWKSDCALFFLKLPKMTWGRSDLNVGQGLWEAVERTQCNSKSFQYGREGQQDLDPFHLLPLPGRLRGFVQDPERLPGAWQTGLFSFFKVFVETEPGHTAEMFEFAMDSIFRSFSNLALMKDMPKVALLGGKDSGKTRFKGTLRGRGGDANNVYQIQQGRELPVFDTSQVCAQEHTNYMCDWNLLNKADVVFVFVTDDDAPIVNNIWHMLQTDRFQVTVAIKLLLD